MWRRVSACLQDSKQKSKAMYENSFNVVLEGALQDRKSQNQLMKK
jgi:hypothetical protein